LTLRALTFKDGQFIRGGGCLIDSGAIVDIGLCVFNNCRATDSNRGGGEIYVNSNIGNSININGSKFTGNTAAGNGNDI